MNDCKRCNLWKTRNNIVVGKGNPTANIMILGEAPGRDEDRIGTPFVGSAGKVLDRMLEIVDLTLDDVYICNVIRCRPYNNRNPSEDEIDKCSIYLVEQIKKQKPSLIILLGKVACSVFFGDKIIGRGKIFEKCSQFFLHLFHPAASLYNTTYKIRNEEYLIRNKEALQILRITK